MTIDHKFARHNVEVGAALDLLCETFPKAFAHYQMRRRPLKIGIHLDILAALGGAVTEAELSVALRCYTVNKVYCSRLRAGATRFDLAGEPAGVVSPEHAFCLNNTAVSPEQGRRA